MSLNPSLKMPVGDEAATVVAAPQPLAGTRYDDVRPPKLDMSSEAGGIKSMAAWLALYLLIVLLLQLYIPYPVDDDTAYHFSVGQLMRKYGILHSFPWTRFSWQADHYADKEFLLHVLFMPLGGLGFNNASRLVGVVGGSLILGTLYLILRAEKVRPAGVWALLPLGASIFVYRLAQVRPHLFSIALALLVLWAYSRGRLRILATAALLYPLTYVAFWQIPLMLVVAAEIARVLARERFRWQPAAVLTAGIVIGVALHPNSFNLVRINWIHMTDILFRNAWGGKLEFNLGQEFEPFSIPDLLRFLLLTLVMSAAAVLLAWRHRRESSHPLAFALAALFFGLLTLRTNRFLEYYVPFSVLALGVASRRSRKRHLAPALLGIAVFYTVAVGTYPYQVLGSYDLKTWYLEPDDAQLFAQQIPVGAKVFTCGWEFTGSLMLNLPERYFMVALDPTLLYERDPKLYDLWYRTLLDAPGDAAEIVRRQFDSRFVACLDHPSLHNFFDSLTADRNVRVVLSNGKWALFDLGPAGQKR